MRRATKEQTLLRLLEAGISDSSEAAEVLRPRDTVDVDKAVGAYQKQSVHAAAARLRRKGYVVWSYSGSIYIVRPGNLVNAWYDASIRVAHDLHKKAAATHSLRCEQMELFLGEAS